MIIQNQLSAGEADRKTEISCPPSRIVQHIKKLEKKGEKYLEFREKIRNSRSLRVFSINFSSINSRTPADPATGR